MYDTMCVHTYMTVSLYLYQCLVGYLSLSTLVHCPEAVLFVQYIRNSYLAVILVHEVHGQMHHNYCQITSLFTHDLYTSTLVSHIHLIAGNSNFGC